MRVQRDNSKDTITVYTSCTRKLDWILDSECSDHIVNDVWLASAIRKKKLKKEGKRDSLMRVGYVTWTSITRKSPGNRSYLQLWNLHERKKRCNFDGPIRAQKLCKWQGFDCTNVFITSMTITVKEISQK